MKRSLGILFACFVLSVLPASAQQGAPPGSQMLQPAPGPAIGGGAVGVPTYVVPPQQVTVAPAEGGVINIGASLGPVLQPYVEDLVNALILGLVTWLAALIRSKLNVSIDQNHRDALVRALQNQAGSLIADGFVKIDGAKVNVPNQQLAEAANEVLAVIPDAAARLGLTPDYVAKRIIDMIPQTAAGAAMVTAKIGG